jgi:lupus La protein
MVCTNSSSSVQKPRIQSSEAPKDDVKKENGKRAREDGGAAAEPPAKKVDTKAETAPTERND